MKQKDLLVILAIIIIAIVIFSVPLNNLLLDDETPRITLATTTSTDNSGLLDYLHKQLKQEINLEIDVVAVGTGAALEYATSGLADVVIVHARSLEDQFINEGYGIHRVDLMYNDFIIVGPSEDPANITGLSNSTEIFNRIYQSRNELEFISRGDNSGTHVKELDLWTRAGIYINASEINWANANPWYLESGSGMGNTLTITSESQAYTLTDRGTWLFVKENLNLEMLAEGPELWHNPYGVILVNPEKFNNIKIEFDLAKDYVKWLISTTGQELINNYKINGNQAFFADFMSHINEMSQEEKEFWEIN